MSFCINHFWKRNFFVVNVFLELFFLNAVLILNFIYIVVTVLAYSYHITTAYLKVGYYNDANKFLCMKYIIKVILTDKIFSSHKIKKFTQLFPIKSENKYTRQDETLPPEYWYTFEFDTTTCVYNRAPKFYSIFENSSSHGEWKIITSLKFSPSPRKLAKGALTTCGMEKK